MDVGDVFTIGGSKDLDHYKKRVLSSLRAGRYPNNMVQATFDLCGRKIRFRLLHPLQPFDGETDESYAIRLRTLESKVLRHHRGMEGLVNVKRGPVSEETREKHRARWADEAYRVEMITKLRNRGPVSLESRERMAEAKFGARNPKSKAVRVTWPDGYFADFGSQTEAARYLGVSQQLLNLWISGKVKTRLGKHYLLEGIVLSAVGGGA